MNHPVTWHSPASTWDAFLANGSKERFFRPALLRFAKDDFMEEITDLLQKHPKRLPDRLVRPETWRDAGGYDERPVSGLFDAVKMFQPAHQRYYLVTASLVCKVRGLPDKVILSGKDEAASFVVRRLVAAGDDIEIDVSNSSTYDEYGWFEEAGWKRIENRDQVDISSGNDTFHREERLPLFAISYPENSNGRKRRLLAGLVPVAAREKYEAAPRAGAPPPDQESEDDPLADPRINIFRQAVPDQIDQLQEYLTPGRVVQVRELFAFLLLDFAQFLEQYAKKVWDALEAESSAGLNSREINLYNALRNTVLVPGTSYADALKSIFGKQDILIGGDTAPGSGLITDSLTEGQLKTAFSNYKSSTITSRVIGILNDTDPPAAGDLPGAPTEVDAAAGALYMIRCVYERPNCEPYLRKPVVSAPSQPFQLASFFDADAPARPLRITMPVDTSPAGLRKFPKNVSVLLSDKLRQQMGRVKGISALEEGEIDEPGSFDLGMICSLSIPIITICALILLMIIVQLLNIVFWWLPFFKICLPCNLKS